MRDDELKNPMEGLQGPSRRPGGTPRTGSSQIPVGISHYRVIAKLGEGGMGVVYHAVDTILDRPVAIKVLPYSDTERRRRFYTEAKAASALNHPNIITIYEIGSYAGGDFIVMELVEGQTLRARIEQGQIPVAEAVRLAVQIASALGAAHAKGIVHRDVKPANVMITGSGLVRVDLLFHDTHLNSTV